MAGSGIVFQGVPDTSIIKDSLTQSSDQSQDLAGFQQELKNGKLHLDNTFQYVSEEDLGVSGAVINLDLSEGSNSRIIILDTAAITINVPTLDIRASSGQIWIGNGVGAVTITKGTNVRTVDGNALEFSQAPGKIDVLYWSASQTLGIVLLSVSKDIL